jgi:hypothetical protein
MSTPKWSAKPLTEAQKHAHAAFKNTPLVKPPSNEEIEKKAFDENRERLKTLRLAREAARISRLP